MSTNPSAARSPNSCPSSDGQDSLLVRAVEEYQALARAGLPADPRAYAQRYPEIAAELLACLEGLELVNQAVPELSGTASSWSRCYGPSPTPADSSSAPTTRP